MLTRSKRFLSVALVLLAVAGCAGEDNLETIEFERPETHVAYEIELTGLPSEEMTDLAQR